MKRYWFVAVAVTILTMIVVLSNNVYVPTNKLYFIKDFQTVDVTKVLFNTSYFMGNDMRIYGYGRNKNGHNRLYLKILKQHNSVEHNNNSPSVVTLPDVLKETHIGEVKGVVMNDRPYLYLHNWGGVVNINNFSFELPKDCLLYTSDAADE